MNAKIFTQFLAVMLAIIVSCEAVAQEVSDTITGQSLHEVVVQAPKVIRKADMDVYFPSQSAVEYSRNGMQLLHNLMIPSLSVVEAMGTIKAGGQSVQVRINGREATIDQVKALLPQTIKRVEWIDNPGLRYQGTNYVLNFIVANPTLGGSMQAEDRQALNTAWGDYFVDSKFNNGRSQWDVGANFKLTNKVKSHRDYTETFTYPDGTSLTRDETPIGGHCDNTYGRLWGAYTYIKPDTTIFYVEASVAPTFSDDYYAKGRMSLTDGSEDILLSDSHGDHGTTPRFSAYLEQHFRGRQTLVVDFNATLYFGKSYSDYLEQTTAPPVATLSDIHTMIKDRNQAYALQANYIKRWKQSKFTAGASYTANRNRSRYENLEGEVFHQHQDKVYLFAEYLQRIQKVTLTAGLGAQFTKFQFKETEQGNHFCNLRPQASINYRLNDDHQFRLSFQSWQSAPSLAQTNVAPQQIDGFQWRIGNPHLKTSNSYQLTFRYNFSLPIMEVSLGVRAFTSPNAITPILYWADDKLINSYENSRGLQNLTFFLSPQVVLIPNWLMASGHVQYRMERMRGTGYKFYNHNWSGNVDVMLTHWGFELVGQYVRAQHHLWGEKISWGENLTILQLSYNWRNWQFGAGVIMPFGRYDQGSKMLSPWNTNEQHLRLDMSMPYVSVSYHLQWGRQKRGASKLFNADASVEKSSAAGR
ncbi:MAG: outer membrane beta-barrel family protein [Bacteroidales bacterium]|nr:outer membrane beta-barrel family protein [Bacteroidales bacterium]